MPIEHATNLIGTSVILNSTKTSFYAQPQTLIDYFAMYAYPISFIGAIFFTILEFIDVRFQTIFFNRNISVFINLLFILSSFISLSVFYNFLPSSIPYIGPIFSFKVPYILPLNTQSVITQL
jgi:hypothetical protein